MRGLESSCSCKGADPTPRAPLCPSSPKARSRNWADAPPGKASADPPLPLYFVTVFISRLNSTAGFVIAPMALMSPHCSKDRSAPLRTEASWPCPWLWALPAVCSQSHCHRKTFLIKASPVTLQSTVPQPMQDLFFFFFNRVQVWSWLPQETAKPFRNRSHFGPEMQPGQRASC